jgi:hypothetical protein
MEYLRTANVKQIETVNLCVFACTKRKQALRSRLAPNGPTVAFFLLNGLWSEGDCLEHFRGEFAPSVTIWLVSIYVSCRVDVSNAIDPGNKQGRKEKRKRKNQKGEMLWNHVCASGSNAGTIPEFLR